MTENKLYAIAATSEQSGWARERGLPPVGLAAPLERVHWRCCSSWMDVCRDALSHDSLPAGCRRLLTAWCVPLPPCPDEVRPAPADGAGRLGRCSAARRGRNMANRLDKNHPDRVERRESKRQEHQVGRARSARAPTAARSSPAARSSSAPTTKPRATPRSRATRAVVDVLPRSRRQVPLADRSTTSCLDHDENDWPQGGHLLHARRRGQPALLRQQPLRGRLRRHRADVPATGKKPTSSGSST